MEKIALILAGGKGARLWPLSRENYPKQFVEVKKGLSLFQLTLKRLLECFSPGNIFIVSQENYKFTLQNQIEFLPRLKSRAVNSIKNNLIFEPVSRNTLPAILLSIKYMESRRALKETDLICVFPSDHAIEESPAFKKCMEKAKPIAGKNKLVVFGVKPASAKEGYGYVLIKDKFRQGFIVDRFIEKPSLARAQGLLNKGALWNAGIFCFNKKTFLGELRAFQPKIHEYYNSSYDGLAKSFRNLPDISIDYGIMQKTKQAALVKFPLAWSDLGSWDSVFQFHSGGKGNFNIGKAEFIDSRDCFVVSPRRLVGVLGLSGVIAVDSGDSLLLVKKGCSDKVKELVSVMNKKGHNQSKESSTVYRPWGYYTVLHQEKNYKVKEIGIYPGRSLSLQKHRHRSEHWNVVRGEVAVSVDGEEKQAKRNESVFVPRNARHRIYNPTDKPARIIEVQIGDYVGEDDILRFGKY